jgi:hypothetical protein
LRDARANLGLGKPDCGPFAADQSWLAKCSWKCFAAGGGPVSFVEKPML